MKLQRKVAREDDYSENEIAIHRKEQKQNETVSFDKMLVFT